MSTEYYTPPEYARDGDVAEVRDVNSINDATDAAFVSLETDLDGITDEINLATGKAKAWSVGPGDPPDQDNEVEPGLYSSSKYAENSSISATASANSATASASSATASASSASSASTSATNSANSATASSLSATASEASSVSSATSATDSSNSATASASSATASAASATNSATSATASANSAIDSSNSATASALSATNSANSATDSANSASNSATSASESLSSATDSEAFSVASEASSVSSATSASESAASAAASLVQADRSEGEADRAQAIADSLPLTYVGSVTGNGIDNTDPVNPVTKVTDSINLSDSTTLASALAVKTLNDSLALKANLSSPTFTGTPTAPTPATSDNSTKVATTSYTRDAISTFAPTTPSVGVGQTWQVVSRALDVTYTNSTGKPIFVHIIMKDSGSFGTTLTVDGVALYTGNMTYYNVSFAVVIPDGSTYRLTGENAIHNWRELR